MGQEFQDAVESDQWDVLPTGDRINLYHCHWEYNNVTKDANTPMKFLVDEETRKCRVCETPASDFVWFRYKTWKLRHLTQ